jgi:DNA-binding CsgD family transcriptional regulator
MALALSSGDQRQLAVAIEALLSPLAYETREDWFRAITREIRPLLRGDSTIATVSSGESLISFSEDAPELASGFDAVTAFRRGELHFTDAEMEEVTHIARRERALGVFTSEILDRLSSGQLRRSLFYSDVCRPLGAHFNYGMGLGGSHGAAVLGVNARRPRRDPLSGDTLALLALLAPPFQAGFEMLARLERSRVALASTFDMLSEGMFVFDAAACRELHRNPALVAILSRDPEAGLVEYRARALARTLHGIHRWGARGHARRTENGALPGLDDVRTACGCYSLRASVLPTALYAREQVVLVTVERHGIVLPTTALLRERFGLTPREAQVALRLAQGDSDAELARSLNVSPHTVRHHAERVFRKLQLHSRKALALRLATVTS